MGEAKRRRAAKAAAPTDFWHSRHACGHSVYWSDMEMSLRIAAFPCPWCGGEAGEPIAETVLTVVNNNPAGPPLIAFRDKLPDGSVPWHGAVRLRHRADDLCCAPERAKR